MFASCQKLEPLENDHLCFDCFGFAADPRGGNTHVHRCNMNLCSVAKCLRATHTHTHTHTHTQTSLQSRLEKVGLNALIRFRRSDDECRRLSAKNNDRIINVLHEGSFVFIHSDFSPGYLFSHLYPVDADLWCLICFD